MIVQTMEHRGVLPRMSIDYAGLHETARRF